MNEIFKKAENRIAIMKELTNPTYKQLDTYGVEEWQENTTPSNIVDKMVAIPSLENKQILVQFNLEFIEPLIYSRGINKGDITFLADSRKEELFAKEVYGVNVILNEKGGTNDDIKILMECIMADNKKFDIVFSNPPYNKGLDLKILNAMFKQGVATEYIIVHPSTWALDKKGIKTLYNTFRDSIDRHVPSIELFNGNPIFGISLFCPCAITHIDFSYTGDSTVAFFNDVFTVDSIYDISSHGKAWDKIVNPVFTNMKEWIANNVSVWDHRIKNTDVDNNKHHLQFADIRGHVTLNSTSNKILKDDFYTIAINDAGSQKHIKSKTRKNIYEFDTALERDNFYDYIKTDFVRFMLSLYKINSHLDAGEMGLIPWLDFTKTWTDEDLYKEFGIDETTQEYITEFIPDYYGLRK